MPYTRRIYKYSFIDLIVGFNNTVISVFLKWTNKIVIKIRFWKTTYSIFIEHYLYWFIELVQQQNLSDQLINRCYCKKTFIVRKKYFIFFWNNFFPSLTLI